VVCGDDEARQFERLTHWNRTLERLSSSGRFRFEHVKGLEHSLLNAGPRERTMSLLTSFVLSLAHDGPLVNATASSAGDTAGRGEPPAATPGIDAPA
jgi:hypothetical protein